MFSDKTYNTLLQSHCQNTDMKIVNELLCVMVRKSIAISVSSYRDVIRLMCRKQMFHSALGLKKFMLADCKLSSAVIYNILLFRLFLTGNCSLVDSLLEELQVSGQQLDEAGYNFVIYGFSICKEMSRSLDYLNEMISKGLRPSNRCLRSVMCYLCRTGQVDNALHLSELINSRGWIYFSTLQLTLVNCLLSLGRIHQAERCLAQVMENGLVPVTINYENLIKKFCWSGRMETAVNLLNQMLKKKSVPDSTCYDCLVQRFCAYNNLNRAMDFHNEMLERNLKPSISTWDLLIETTCRNGLTRDAGKLLMSMIEAGETPTRQMYTSVIDRYRFEKNLSRASEWLQNMQKHGYEPDFTIQWSLISSLSNVSGRNGTDSSGFLSKLLLDSGFPSERGPMSKLR